MSSSSQRRPQAIAAASDARASPLAQVNHQQVEAAERGDDAPLARVSHQLRTTPARKARTECCCTHPVACKMAAIVVPMTNGIYRSNDWLI
jgi:hypothetical protein